jgi:hypothetical protein
MSNGATGTDAGQLLGQESSLSSWAGPYVTDMLGKGQALAQTPYVAYQGPLSAGASSLQQQAFTGLAGLNMPAASTAGSFTGAAYEMTGGSPTTVTSPTSVVQQYMNPYIEAALRPQYEAATRQAQIAAQNLQSQYGKAGAYGGSRQGIAEAELQRGLLDRLSNITGQGYAQAYDKAADLFGREQDYGLRALAAQQTGGAQQRAIEQQGIAADIGQFREERDFPYKQVQYQQSLLQGLPLATQSYSYSEPGAFSQFLGNASGIIGLLQGLGLIESQG